MVRLRLGSPAPTRSIFLRFSLEDNLGSKLALSEVIRQFREESARLRKTIVCEPTELLFNELKWRGWDYWQEYWHSDPKPKNVTFPENDYVLSEADNIISARCVYTYGQISPITYEEIEFIVEQLLVLHKSFHIPILPGDAARKLYEAFKDDWPKGDWLPIKDLTPEQQEGIQVLVGFLDYGDLDDARNAKHVFDGIGSGKASYRFGTPYTKIEEDLKSNSYSILDGVKTKKFTDNEEIIKRYKNQKVPELYFPYTVTDPNANKQYTYEHIESFSMPSHLSSSDPRLAKQTHVDDPTNPSYPGLAFTGWKGCQTLGSLFEELEAQIEGGTSKFDKISLAPSLKLKPILVFGKEYSSIFSIAKAVCDLYKLNHTIENRELKIKPYFVKTDGDFSKLGESVKTLLPASYERMIERNQQLYNYKFAGRFVHSLRRSLRQVIEPALNENKEISVPFEKLRFQTKDLIALHLWYTLRENIDGVMIKRAYHEHFLESKVRLVFSKGADGSTAIQFRIQPPTGGGMSSALRIGAG